MRGLALALLLALAARPGLAHEGEAHVPPPVDDPFSAPVAGSYELPPIQRVSEHALLGTDGARVPLLGVTGERLAVVSFVYRACSDATGCPLSLAVLSRVDRALAARPELAGRVRLATVSFDPARDTPAKMGELAGLFAPRGEWVFLTAASPEELAPVLADFGQDVVELEPGVLRHVLKVFLVDGEGRVRNVYSTGFLRADVILADVETLLGASAERAQRGEAERRR
jgi:cytochrome oxidase Cu insertion factor (SCO1/SenC/PrrC family)